MGISMNSIQFAAEAFTRTSQVIASALPDPAPEQNLSHNASTVVYRI
ncbi:hypothetical protein SAMN04488002_3560 [Litoreibacter janthinus]|uniref:Uncharacterized protein n=1 Tax=Litoreibacter janthinus TaxID=670154 RepID=A0A1I6HYA5_9RHOB|nr:hypothetical protein SAMN04488002_3560 [Litoreibacter janthinus]